MKRTCRSLEYNWDFDTETGYFQRWGTKYSDDPSYSPIGPEILDMEISTICHGTNQGPCSFCYKGNTANGKYMSLEKFKLILSKIPSNLTQIAFGIGDIDSHPNLEKILALTRKEGIIPNITINGYRTTHNNLSLLATNCGSIAVSRYDDDVCFNTVHSLAHLGAKQVNIHQVISPDSVQDCLNLIDSIRFDKRLETLNALVFLMIKPKGRALQSQPVSMNDFEKVVSKALDSEIPFGFDSCSAPSFIKTIENQNNKNLLKFVEPCEAFLFSSYCNTEGEFFPCSFCEGEPDWKTGLLVTEETNFIQDIWNHKRMENWRHILTTSSDTCTCNNKSHCRSCPIYKQVTICKNI